MNKEGPELTNDEPVPEIDTIETLEQTINNSQSVLVDTRPAQEFGERHLPGSINIPFNKSFPNWAGWLVEYDQDIYVLCDQNQVQDVKIALQSIGLDQLKGFAKVDILDEARNTESYELIDVPELNQRLDEGSVYLIDVRNQSEWNQGHIRGANHMMLGKLKDRLDEIPSDKDIVLQCQSGQRSAIATSLLQGNGFKNVINLKGGFGAWLNEGMPVEK